MRCRPFYPLEVLASRLFFGQCAFAVEDHPLPSVIVGYRPYRGLRECYGLVTWGLRRQAIAFRPYRGRGQIVRLFIEPQWATTNRPKPRSGDTIIILPLHEFEETTDAAPLLQSLTLIPISSPLAQFFLWNSPHAFCYNPDLVRLPMSWGTGFQPVLLCNTGFQSAYGMEHKLLAHISANMGWMPMPTIMQMNHSDKTQRGGQNWKFRNALTNCRTRHPTRSRRCTSRCN